MDDDFTDYEVLHNYYEDEEEFASPTPSPFPEPVANSWEVSQVQEKDQRSFPEEKTELLIETIKKYPSLWNIKDKNYRNRVERNSDWTKVLVEIGLTHNHKECTRKRWDSIKTNYTRSKNIPSGSGAQKKYRHAILLAFLDDTQTPRATKTVMNEGRVNKVVEGKKVSY
ncbi:uncharacterized protein LOC129943039 isoform X6 [Eupeodes corollae]|uniref:uncharacterized protein LOC129943039 isoform X6 n=1 Tax=Eupeodes corollae TaxID=290404 RepID=UPI0024919432|nr:uncharacterized protein LOC129943039 isoform X6 [Eupeodes corollae]